MNITQEAVDRFWTRVDKERSTIFYNGTRCWEWTAAHHERGYGFAGIGGGKRNRAHRISWTIANGEIPDDLQVLHHCDNPPCVNPDHLFLGTRKDNMQDKLRKGRANYPVGDESFSRLHPERLPRGEDAFHAKLTWEKVREIRKRYSEGSTLISLGNEFGVHFSTVQRIVKNKYWIEYPEVK